MHCANRQAIYRDWSQRGRVEQKPESEIDSIVTKTGPKFHPPQAACSFDERPDIYFFFLFFFPDDTALLYPNYAFYVGFF